MTHAWKLSSAAACTLLVGFSVTTFANSLPSAPQHAHEVRMTAKKYAFDPDVITVNKGKECGSSLRHSTVITDSNSQPSESGRNSRRAFPQPSNSPQTKLEPLPFAARNSVVWVTGA